MTQFFVDKSQCKSMQIFPGVTIHTTCGDQLMLSLVDMEPGAIVEEHSHPHEQMGLMLEGEGTFSIGGQTQLVKTGQMWRIPGGVKHRVVAGPRGMRALDVFHPIREDYQ